MQARVHTAGASARVIPIKSISLRSPPSPHPHPYSLYSAALVQASLGTQDSIGELIILCHSWRGTDEERERARERDEMRQREKENGKQSIREKRIEGQKWQTQQCSDDLKVQTC